LAESKVKIEELTKNLTKDKADIEKLNQLKSKTEKDLEEQKKNDDSKIK